MTTIKFKKLNIEAYKPGKSSAGRFKKIIKLSANESALGVSSKVKKIISKKNLVIPTIASAILLSFLTNI